MNESGFCIRKALVSDAQAISVLICEEMGYDADMTLVKEQLARCMASRSDCVLVAEVDGAVVGFIHACDYQLLYVPPMKNIMGIAVASVHRRRGIGRALLDAVERWARTDGALGVRLVSGAQRTEAHLFYRACGYCGDRQQVNLKKLF